MKPHATGHHKTARTAHRGDKPGHRTHRKATRHQTAGRIRRRKPRLATEPLRWHATPSKQLRRGAATRGRQLLPLESRGIARSDQHGFPPPRTGTLAISPSTQARKCLWWKRMIDLCCVLFALPVVVPVSLALCAWIELVSPGPPIFRQTRIGRGIKPFTIYKFRTMHLQAEANIHSTYITRLIRNNRPMLKMDGMDGRLIRGARIIRRLGLDELPQIWNILRGEMSVVGPRPCVPCELPFYDTRQIRRFDVPAGLTGLWQVRRDRFTTFRNMIEMDLEYVSRMSITTDFRIMLMTPVALLGRSGESPLPAEQKHPLWPFGHISP